MAEVKRKQLNPQGLDISKLDKSKLNEIAKQVKQEQNSGVNIILNQLKDELKQWAVIEKISWNNISKILNRAYGVNVSAISISAFAKANGIKKELTAAQKKAIQALRAKKA